ncbi:MAG: hypothetical protein GXO94_09200 [Nitrospirae bacterium]|nr:hypothetical protein [Nitrospirota bacterium]
MAGKGRQRKQKSASKKGRVPVVWIIFAFSLLILVLAVSGKIPFSNTDKRDGRSFHVNGGETRPVVDPSMFTGLTRAAYAAARNYPEVLDQVYCYCDCSEPPFYHKSLLSCFTEDHGAG